MLADLFKGFIGDIEGEKYIIKRMKMKRLKNKWDFSMRLLKLFKNSSLSFYCLVIEDIIVENMNMISMLGKIIYNMWEIR